MAMEMDVCIVGGGLAGLALAIGMQERGIRAHVFEKVPLVRTHTGTAISLAANGLRALDGVKAGLSGTIMKEGAHIKHLRWKLTAEEKTQRSKDFVKSVLQYPECMMGEPDTT